MVGSNHSLVDRLNARSERLAAKAARVADRQRRLAARDEQKAAAHGSNRRRYPLLVGEYGLLKECEAVERLVQQHYGVRVNYLSGKMAFQEKALRRKRRYGHHIVNVGEEGHFKLGVFTKSLVRRPDRADMVERFLSNVDRPEFKAPLYFGQALTEEGILGCWEFVDGRRCQFLHQASIEDLRRIVRAVAGINALTPLALDCIPTLKRGMKDLTPLSIQVKIAVDHVFPHADIPRDILAGLEAFALREQSALNRFEDLGFNYFSHQDIGVGNILFTAPDQPLIVIDWESAFLGVAGSSLRRLAQLKLPIQQELAGLYVECMESHGIVLRFRDVLFAMQATQTFYSLGWASRRHAEKPQEAKNALIWGLRNAAIFLET